MIWFAKRIAFSDCWLSLILEAPLFIFFGFGNLKLFLMLQFFFYSPISGNLRIPTALWWPRWYTFWKVIDSLEFHHVFVYWIIRWWIWFYSIFVDLPFCFSWALYIPLDLFLTLSLGFDASYQEHRIILIFFMFFVPALQCLYLGLINMFWLRKGSLLSG